MCLIDIVVVLLLSPIYICTFLFTFRIEDGLSAGDTLTFEVTNNFIVDYYDGTKSIVVSNTNDLGGRNLYWGQSLPTIGGIVLVLALLIAVSARRSFVPRARCLGFCDRRSARVGWFLWDRGLTRKWHTLTTLDFSQMTHSTTAVVPFVLGGLTFASEVPR